MINWLGQIIAGGFTSPKTTVTAIVAAIAVFLAQMGIIEISQEAQLSIVTIALVVIGWLSKDSNKRGLPLDTDY